MVVLGASACGNVSLSSSSESPTAAGSLHAADAEAPNGAFPNAGEGGSPTPGEAGADAGGAASTERGSPLCSFGIGGALSYACYPDTSAMCSPSGDDAGVAYYPTSDEGGASDGGADASPPKTACHLIGSTQACTVAGEGRDGAQCQSATDCAADFECIEGVGTPGQCRHYCCSGNSSCGSTANPTFCDVQSMASGGLDVPVCMPVSSCTLLAPMDAGAAPGMCAANETCAVVKDDGTTSCVRVGVAQMGDGCEGDAPQASADTGGDPYHCAAGLTCLGAVGSRTCFKLCSVALPSCPTGTTCTSSAQLFTDATVGICQ